MKNGPMAHVDEDGRIHALHDHLLGTAKKASIMAAEFGCGEWGYLAGLWHDIGKYSEDFQKIIHAASGLDAQLEAKLGRVDDLTAGSVSIRNRNTCIA